jgi:pyruvate dehydrogenase E1 component alpha subunit
MFEHVYEEPTDRLREQQSELAALREKYGDESFEEVLQ